jgi:phospholipase/carboxylesterase
MLHGTGDDEHGLLALAQQISPGAAVLSPRGMVLEGTHSRFFRRLEEGVFDEDDLRERADELAGFINAAGDAYGFEPGSLFAVGFSNGANMAAALLLTHPEVLTGAVLIATVPPFTAPPDTDLGGRRVLISNGRQDPMAPLERTVTLTAQLRDRGADVELHTHPGGHQVAPEHLPAMRSLVRGAS